MAATNVDFVTNPTKQTVLWYLILVSNIGRNKNLCKSVVVFDCNSADLPFSIWIFMSLSDYFYILILWISFPIVMISIPIVLVSTYSILLIRSRSYIDISFAQNPSSRQLYSKGLSINYDERNLVFLTTYLIHWHFLPYECKLFSIL